MSQLGRSGADVVEFNVPVDSGAIKIARNPADLEKGGELYDKIQELALWSAIGVWDGKKGAIGTPTGDGDHRIVYDPAADIKVLRDLCGMQYNFLVNNPNFKKSRGFTLHLGDTYPAGSIDFPEHITIGFGWVDSQRLLFVSVND